MNTLNPLNLETKQFLPCEAIFQWYSDQCTKIAFGEKDEP